MVRHSSTLKVFSPPPRILQSVRGHSAVVLTVTINGMQEIHPVIYLLFKLSQLIYIWLLMEDVSISHIATHHSRYDSSGRVISPSQIPLPDNTQHSQQTDIHAPGGIRTHDLSRQAAADLRLRPRGYWDRQ